MTHVDNMIITVRSIRFRLWFVYPFEIALTLCGSGNWIYGGWLNDLAYSKGMAYKEAEKFRRDNWRRENDIRIPECDLWSYGDPGSGCIFGWHVSIKQWDWKAVGTCCPLSKTDATEIKGTLDFDIK